MNQRLLQFVATLSILILTQIAHGEDWPGWRGPRGDGSSSETAVPTKWDGETGQNIAWKVPLPAHGHSSPIVWKDRVFVVGCDRQKEERVLAAFARDTGKLLWKKVVLKAPLEKKHNLNSYASGTPVTDGKLIYVTFLAADFGSTKQATPGHMVVAAYDLDGNQKWMVKPGRFSSKHGYCSSPVLFKDKLIVNGDHDGDSYIVALDRTNGEELWRVSRKHKTRSYVTPIIREIDGRTQMLLSGSLCVTSYDPNDGKLHWRMKGPTQQFVASLVYNGEYLFLTAGFPEYHILCIQPDGKGEVDDSKIVWRTTKGCSYVPSPIVEANYFLVVSDKGVASCFEAKTGERHWMERIGPHYSASLVKANGLVYFLSDQGIMTIVRPGKELEIVAENKLGEYCFASPAISDGRIFLRGEKHLYCIAVR